MNTPWWFNANAGYRLGEELEWEFWEPTPWRGYTIIADRHLPDGTRQHLVKGSVHKGTVVANAQIIGEDD